MFHSSISWVSRPYLSYWQVEYLNFLSPIFLVYERKLRSIFVVLEWLTSKGKINDDHVTMVSIFKRWIGSESEMVDGIARKWFFLIITPFHIYSKWFLFVCTTNNDDILQTERMTFIWFFFFQPILIISDR